MRVRSPFTIRRAISILPSGGSGGSPSDVSWDDVTGKPTDFPPSSHSHPTSQVTGLDTALSNKQPLATVLTNTTAAFTTAQETKLSGIASGAQVNVPTDLGYTAATRELTSSTGSDVTLPLATETTPGLAATIEAGPTRYYAFDDFVNIVANGQAIGDWVVTNSGTGAGQTNASHGYAVGVGWVAFNTGTTATGRTARTLSTAALYLDAGPAKYRAVGKTDFVSTAIERFTLRLGFIDNAAGESTDGVFFRYTDNDNSGKWQAVHRRAGVETAQDTGVTFAATTVYKFEIETNNSTNQSVFKIDGSTVATLTTNFPDNGLTGAGVLAIKSVGTTSRQGIIMDYQMVEQILTGRL